jgi:uncharacterized protein DUF5916
MPARSPAHLPVCLAVALAVPLLPAVARAAAPAEEAPEIHIVRATGPITIDGDLSDPGWRGATRVDTWYETNPADNVPARVKNVGYLAYDDRYFYAGFEFDDPDPKSIRAPFGDRDNVPGYTDYGGVILDTRDDHKSAYLLVVNPHNIQYDAINSDAAGEDASIDLYWDSATRITAKGWVLEMRIPFSSLRYSAANPQTWGILLYRNWPRQFRTQMFTSKLPRGSNCFICHRSELTGLEGLPSAQHLVLAPYATVRRDERPAAEGGSPLASSGTALDGGLDAKWTANADTAIDATVNPDFSQVESDVAQVGVNERFALFYPEKRPFFLEGLDLFSLPIQAVYTRTITSPRWGARATGELLDTTYTFLVTEDRGGGSVVLPGPTLSGLAPQDFASKVVIGRARHDFGGSFASFVLTDREIAGGGHNRVAGPDFQWRPTRSDALTGQLLLSDTQTPDRPELDVPEWDGRQLRSHALYLGYSHVTREFDVFGEVRDIGDDFRADAGFLPQVGYRGGVLEVGHSLYPEARLFSTVRPYLHGEYSGGQDGSLIFRRASAGIEESGRWTSHAFVEYRVDEVRVGGAIIPRDQLYWTFDMSPSRTFAQFGMTGTLGEEVDVTNARPGRGDTLVLRATIRPTDHLELRLNGTRQWLDVAAEPGGARRERLFTADVARVKATYTFTSRMFLRLIAQRQRTVRDPLLYLFPVPARDEAVTGSALFAYKLNWQTVLFLGYGDDRALAENGDLVRAGRQLFLKVSYALQR